MANLFGSICLSDIPKELIRTGKNGKKYLSITIGERLNPSARGETHWAKAYVKATERKDNVNYFIGSFSESVWKVKEQQPDFPKATELNDDDDMPF